MSVRVVWLEFGQLSSFRLGGSSQVTRPGFTLFMTGLSGAGKSTLSRMLAERITALTGRPVTLLDGDVVRRLLSSELGFSREHRNLNIARIGYVAGEVTRHGGVAICAAIAPYEEGRRHARELVSKGGQFVEIYMATPLDVCEKRDPKGLYARARRGEIKGFTGIDDPYEPPSHPELTMDASNSSPEESAELVIEYLRRRALLGP